MANKGYTRNDGFFINETIFEEAFIFHTRKTCWSLRRQIRQVIKAEKDDS